MVRLLCGCFLFNFFAVVLGRITNDVFHMQRFYYYNKQINKCSNEFECANVLFLL